MTTDCEQDEFTGLLKKHSGIIASVCNLYCRVQADKEDLSQEILYQLWRSWHRYDNNRKFSTWMYRIALNVAISFHRARKPDPPLEAISEATLLQEQETGNDEQLSRLRMALLALKELDRALMLLYLDGKNYGEISEILGITETNVGTRISRVKEKLKNKLR